MPLKASLLAYGIPTRALFLSKDEKALDALSQVLSDLDVSFEFIHEASFAVKRVASHHFDIILVDCDNEQSATQIFTSAKNSSVNQSTISVAVVDGKNGVANAFRLGASLVLSKPISMEQARGTLRNAIAMLRKSSPEVLKGTPAPQAPNPTISTPVTTAPATSMFSAPVSKPVQPVKPAQPVQTAVTPAPAPKLSESLLKTTLPGPTPAETRHSDDGSPAPKTAKTKSLSLVSDDLGSSSTNRHPSPPTFGMAAEKEKSARKTSPFLVGAVAVALVLAGVYGYAMVNPGFQSLVTSQFTNLEVMVGLAPKPQAVAQLPRPAQPPKPALPANQAAPAAAGSSDTAANQPPDGFAQPSPVAPSQGFASNAAPQKSAAPVILSTSATTTSKPTAESEPLVVAEDAADSHVAYRVQPAYPETARKKGVKGSVVLNASVDKDGNVSGLEVVSGNPQLANAAVAAVKQWRYEAYFHNGQPSEFQTQVTVRFPQTAQR